jgi:hypothetical protein
MQLATSPHSGSVQTLPLVRTARLGGSASAALANNERLREERDRGKNGFRRSQAYFGGTNPVR